MIPGIDVGWVWTNDEGAEPAAPASDDRRRRYVGSVMRISWLLIVLGSCA